MPYYSEKNGLRNPIKRTYDISVPMYQVIFECCKRYFDNVAWKYPVKCPDGFGCCGLDIEKLSVDLTFEIPGLYKNCRDEIDIPRDYWEKFDQYALLDFIEFIAKNIKDITKQDDHGYFNHYHLHFSATNNIVHKFRTDINDIFKKTGLLYTLNACGAIERVLDGSIISDNTIKDISAIKEPGLKKIIHEAIALYKSPLPIENKVAVEKIWDAFERLKTYYTELDKKASADKIIKAMSSGQQEIYDLLNEEFKKLTDIGNKFRIRHHETDKYEISDSRLGDYLFNRCFSVISLAIQYLN